MRELNPVFFDSLVLPNPRGLVRAHLFKKEERILRHELAQVRVEVEAGRNLPANDMVQPQPLDVLYLYDLTKGVVERFEEMEEVGNLLQEELRPLCQGCSGRLAFNWFSSNV